MKNLYYSWGLFLYLVSFILFLSGLWMNLHCSVWIWNVFLFHLIYYPVSYLIYLDDLGFIFMAVIFFISGNVVIFSKSYMKSDLYPRRFLFLVLLFILSMALMVISPSYISILLGWDGLGLVSYCLVIYYQNSHSLNAGLMTILSNRVGDYGLLMSIILLMNQTWNMIVLSGLNVIPMIFILLASLTKSAQFPFSAWLPAAMAAPTPVSALVHSSTLVTAGVYLLIRSDAMLQESGWSMWLFNMSLITIIFSGWSACLEKDLKKIVAMSTLSQLGFMMMFLSLGAWKLAYFHMLTHALFKSLLFLSAGQLLHWSQGLQDLRFMGAQSLFSFSSGLGLLISSFCLVGLPFVTGFYSKELMITYFFHQSINLVFILLFIMGLCLTFFYSSRLVMMSLICFFQGFSLMSFCEDKDSFYPIIFLSLSSIFFGSMLEWLMLEYPDCFLTQEIYLMISFLICLFFFTSFHFNFLYENFYFKMFRFLFFSNFSLSQLTSSCSLWVMENNPSPLNEEYWGESLGAWGVFFFVKWSLKFFYSEKSVWLSFLMSVLIFLMLFFYFCILK